MARVHEADISSDAVFQKFFNGFYCIRQRPANFYQCCYSYLERNKNNLNLTFEDVVTYLYQETGSIHASFISKLLATVNPEMPIWDKIVSKISLFGHPITTKRTDCKRRFSSINESVIGISPRKQRRHYKCSKSHSQIPRFQMQKRLTSFFGQLDKRFAKIRFTCFYKCGSSVTLRLGSSPCKNQRATK